MVIDYVNNKQLKKITYEKFVENGIHAPDSSDVLVSVCIPLTKQVRIIGHWSSYWKFWTMQKKVYFDINCEPCKEKFNLKMLIHAKKSLFLH